MQDRMLVVEIIPIKLSVSLP